MLELGSLNQIMKKPGIVFILVLVFAGLVRGQSPFSEQHFRVFDAKGTPSNISDIIKAINAADAVFLGEVHDDSVGHAVQMEVFRQAIAAYSGKRKIALSLEMFERDVQIILNEYLNGLITESQFLAGSRPWGNYKTDYRPLVELAREKKLSVVAANAPRRYVNMVSRNGRNSLNSLSKEARAWIAPLPYGDPSPMYAKKFNDLMAKSGDPGAANAHNPIVFSQALWDATMGNSVANFLKNNKEALVIHLNGSFHTENHLGTVEHLLKYRPKTKVLVVTIRYEDDFNAFDKSKHSDLGDFVILTDSKQPRSKRN